jgi:hypothetical protein
MTEEQRPEEVQRRTAKHRAALIISLLKRETTAVEAARLHGLKVAEVKSGAIASCSERKTHFVLARRKTRRCARKRSIDSSARWVS